MTIAGALSVLDWCRILDILSYKMNDNEEMLTDEWYAQPDMLNEKIELEEDIAHYSRIYDAIDVFIAQAEGLKDE